MFLLHGWKAIVSAVLTILYMTKGIYYAFTSLEYVISLKEDAILNFYQKELPAIAFVQKPFCDLLQAFMVNDDLLNDIEKLYKTQSANSKLLDNDY